MNAQRPVALVTGASSGIGRSNALALAAHGYDVVINYASSKDAAHEVALKAEAAGARAITVQADVADEDAVLAMLGRVDEEFGRLDALVNNAGTTVNTPPSDLDGLSMADWDRVFAVNVRGLFQVTRAAVPLLRRSPHAAVVNTASIVGLRPGPQPFPYAASKAAVVSLTKTLAGALGPEIRVNAVAPGWMVGDWMEDQLGDDYDRLMERRARLTPLRRCVTADDVAQTVVSLITSNPFVTGEIVVIDGGFSATT
ncbi:SDR family NAD(P)-dependent oxidoreductase [Umezawaea tangerina]|uniref:3-oxoacyl-[acyl-carrier protein] reductase n=1 Tax=Umezawaea tangerina TaxID=84725 RepID=A0A2T0T7N6_9PSEU|nr:SDR family oxidoreductase [Umezawaea tangerina]PRY41695.1 3-oxoacyl-[acyl-carrier protein] reductase [Umezawaea tangerina]